MKRIEPATRNPRRSVLPAFLAGLLFAAASLAAPAEDRPAPPRQGRPHESTLKPGDAAPDFTLPVLGRKDETVVLSSFKGRKPVLLIFGSYT
jgi:hypothetical protein